MGVSVLIRSPGERVPQAFRERSVQVTPTFTASDSLLPQQEEGPVQHPSPTSPTPTHGLMGSAGACLLLADPVAAEDPANRAGADLGNAHLFKPCGSCPTQLAKPKNTGEAARYMVPHSMPAGLSGAGPGGQQGSRGGRGGGGDRGAQSWPHLCAEPGPPCPCWHLRR